MTVSCINRDDRPACRTKWLPASRKILPQTTATFAALITLCIPGLTCTQEPCGSFCDATSDGNCCLLLTSNGRRRFPAPPVLDIQNLQPTSSCARSTGDVGCLPLPKSVRPLQPAWAGRLNGSPPECSGGGSGGTQCVSNPPVTRITGLQGTSAISVDLTDYLTESAMLGGPYSRGIALGDVDGDGWLDVVVGKDIVANQLLLNDGAGNFNHVVDLPEEGQYDTKAVALGDLDGDGFLDILFVHGDGPVQLLLNNGTGTFAQPVQFPSADFAIVGGTISLGDVNRDGLLDVVLSNSHPNRPQLILNSGTGFEPPVDLNVPISLWPAAVELGDMDNDEWPDA
eukprot:1378943-Rhodomonas_salina.1